MSTHHSSGLGWLRSQDDADIGPESASRRSRRWLRHLIYASVAVMALYSLRFAPDGASVISHAVTLLLFSGACLTAGALVGFLFGIPRAPHSVGPDPQHEPENGGHSPEHVPQQSGSAASVAFRSYSDNTNLEQVSDWLTKMLIGIGLTQVTSVPGTLENLSDSMSPALGGTPDSEVVASSAVVLFIFLGFIYGYLWSRLAMGRALAEEHYASQSASLEGRIARQERNARAFQLVDQQLDANEPEVALEDIKRALDAAPEASSRVLRKAASRRRDEHEGAKRLLAEGNERAAKRRLRHMERTIRVLEALLTTDWDDASVRSLEHQVHAQLGYALKDKAMPTDGDSTRAIDHFTQAIALSEDEGIDPSPLIVYNRAICRIRSGGGTGAILEDLTAALQSDETLSDYMGDVRNWLEQSPDDEHVRAWTKAHPKLVALVQNHDEDGSRRRGRLHL